MLTKCPECGHDVSTNAEKCPNCGSPINETVLEGLIPEQPKKVQLIEKTSKQYKTQKLIIVGVLLLELILCGNGGGKLTSASGNFGLVLIFVGTIWLFCVAIASWWHHG